MATIEEYRSALAIRDEWAFSSTIQDMAYYIKSKIKELEKPARKEYRCIKNSYPFKQYSIGETIYDLSGELKYSEHPFHFEEIIPEPVKEKITWTEAHAAMWDYWTKHGRVAVFESLMNRIKAEHLS